MLGHLQLGALLGLSRLKLRLYLGICVIKKDPAKAFAVVHRRSPRDLSEHREMQTRLLNMLVKCTWQEG